VHYWADLQLVHGFRCYDNIVSNAEFHRVLGTRSMPACYCYNCGIFLLLCWYICKTWGRPDHFSTKILTNNQKYIMW